MSPSTQETQQVDANIFTEQYAQSLDLADKVYIGECMLDARIPEEKRMNTKELASKIGSKAKAFDKNDDLLAELEQEIKPGDSIIFMSSGSFSGIQYELVKLIEAKYVS